MTSEDTIEKVDVGTFDDRISLRAAMLPKNPTVMVVDGVPKVVEIKKGQYSVGESKLVVPCMINDDRETKYNYWPNNTSRNALVEELGTKPSRWDKQSFRLGYVKQTVQGKVRKVLYHQDAITAMESEEE